MMVQCDPIAAILNVVAIDDDSTFKIRQSKNHTRLSTNAPASNYA